MKTSTLILSAALTFTALSVSANQVEFEKVNNNLETEACYTAATKGMNATKEIVQKSKVSFAVFKNSVMCNGMRINEFAAKYFDKKSSITEKKTIQVVALSALDRSPESQLCLDAVVMGEKAARSKHNMRNTNVVCNGKSLSHFLKTFKNRKVVLDTDESSSIAS
ncbi:hypothetical protein [Agaribacter marinus]|uniref:DUF3718 domain-containing protein n=1 Tax=Agaribacter marinus TaxID=1431249 RepID=A0AA37WLH8_9ALTE|nr:hypothetical protein [Agaribacter marinus]GLR72110.1 hypothetical protein GCM10007852_30180 [Agaribacter marinus]